jgi:hypothetical protein
MRRGARGRVATLAVAMVGLGAVLAPALVSAAEGEGPVTVAIGEGVAALDFDVTPKHLAPDLPTPVTLDLGIEELPGAYSGPPPGLSTVTLDLDRAIEFEPAGLPVCSWPAVQHHLQVDAAGPGECPRAVVGHGEATIEFAYPENDPIKVPAPVKVYDGGIVGGALELLIEIPVAAPLSGTIRLVAAIRRVQRGRIGSELTIVMPTISGGHGMLLDLQLELGRSFNRGGGPAGFVTAKCPRGKLAASMTAVLTDGTEVADESIRACSI